MTDQRRTTLRWHQTCHVQHGRRPTGESHELGSEVAEWQQAARRSRVRRSTRTPRSFTSIHRSAARIVRSSPLRRLPSTRSIWCTAGSSRSIQTRSSSRWRCTLPRFTASSRSSSSIRRSGASGDARCRPPQTPLTVDVFVTTYNEDIDLLRQTVRAAIQMRLSASHVRPRRRPATGGARPLRRARL